MKRREEMYNYFIFDLYGTLIDLQTNEEKDELWKNLALFYSYKGAYYEKEELRESYIKGCKEEIEKNKITQFPDIQIEKVFEKLYSEKGIEADRGLIDNTAVLFRTLSTDYIKLYPGVKEFLEYLKETEKKVILLSNAQRAFTIYEMEYLGILKYFDALYISSDTGISKPDVEFYNIMGRNEKIEKRSAVMIGNDHTTDIRGAHNYGIDSIYIHTNHSRKTAALFENGEYKEKIDIGATYKVLDGDIYKVLKIIKNSDIK